MGKAPSRGGTGPGAGGGAPPGGEGAVPAAGTAPADGTLPAAGGRTAALPEQPASAGGSAPADARKWPATIAVMLGMMCTIMASTMANVAIADIMGAFGVGQNRVHWVSTGFLAATTVCMLLNAWFVHNLGPRNTFLLASALFALAGLLGHFAPTFEGVVAARVLQGACGGVVQPLSLSVIFTVFPAHERGRAMGLFGVGVMLGPALGPLYGGIVIDLLDWRYVFTGPLIFMALGAALGARYLPRRSPGAARARLNWTLLGLAALAITGFLNGITTGQQQGWDSIPVFAMLLVSALATLAFIEIESRTDHPLLNLRLFTDRSFVVTSVVGFVFGAGMFASFYLMPVFVRTVQGFTGTRAGVLLLLGELVTFAVFPLAGWLVQRYPPVYPVAIGMLGFGASSLALSTIDVDSGFAMLVGFIALGRIGLGLAIPAVTAAGLQHLGADLIAHGAGTMNFIRMLGGALGVNCIALTLDLRSAHYFDRLAATQQTLSGTTRSLVDGMAGLLAHEGVPLAQRLPYALAYLEEMIAARADALSFQDGYLALALLFGLATLCALTLPRGGAKSRGAGPAP